MRSRASGQAARKTNRLTSVFFVERTTRFEPATLTLANCRSTIGVFD